MTNTNQARVDEVSRYYDSTKILGKINNILFWVNAILALAIPYSSKLISTQAAEITQVFFLASVLVYFGISQYLSLYAFPKAGRKRRTHMISNSLGVNLTTDTTNLYYNNESEPSIKRLGLNTMENALFSKEILARMLNTKRLAIAAYLIALVVILAIRSSDIELKIAIAQLVFSGEIFVGWLKLELLRGRCEEVYKDLFNYFRQHPEQNNPNETATLLNAFMDYETAKSEAGVSLSSKVYSQINPSLSIKWDKIRSDFSL